MHRIVMQGRHPAVMRPSDLPRLLAASATFGALDEAARAALAGALVWLGLPGGRALFKAGEPSDALYLLASGSLGVFDAQGALRHLLAAGDSVGAAGLVTGEPRRRTVRALRDSQLLRLDRAAFEALLARHPHALSAVAREAVLRAWQEDRAGGRPGAPRTFALLPCTPTVPARALALQLARALSVHGGCAVIDAEQAAGRDSGWFAMREAQQRFVIYLDTAARPSAWRARCLRQADALLLPAQAAEPARPWPEAAALRPERSGHRPRHLLLLHAGRQPALGAARRWRAVFDGALRHHHVCGAADVARVARLASGHGRGLVLAGGGARGLAHLGMLRALREAGHGFDAVGGTSIGAIIGAGVAAGWDLETMTERYREAFVRGRPLSDWTLPLVALTRGRRAARMLQRTFGALAIEDLPLPFFCVSTSLSGNGMAVHREGPLWLWLRASSAIPGVLPPVLHGREVHVDGALVDNLPVDVMAADGLAHITALDIRADTRLTAGVQEAATPPWWKLLLQRDTARRPGLVSTLVRAGMVNGEAASAGRRARADLLLSPPLEHVGMLAWKDWRRAVEAGYRHARSRLEAQDDDAAAISRRAAR